jgi:hypothetical protein
MAGYTGSCFVGDRSVTQQLVITESSNVGIHLIARNPTSQFAVYQFNSEGGTVASITGSNVKARVGTDEVGVNK